MVQILYVGNDRRKNHILCRAEPLSHPDAGSPEVLEHKMPGICGEQGSRDVVLKHNPTHLALDVVSMGSATKLPLAYGRLCHRKTRPPIFLCRTLDEEVFGVYGEHHSHVAAWIVFLGNAHRLTYALGLHRRS